MALAVGYIAASPAAFPPLCGGQRVELARFSISPHALSETALLDSVFASPGRYAGEIWRRLRRIYPGAQRYLVVSPARALSQQAMARVIADAVARPISAPSGVWTDAGGTPLAYQLCAAAVDAIPVVHHGLLTGLPGLGAADARLLGASAGGVETRTLRPGARDLLRGPLFGYARGAGFRKINIPGALSDPAVRAAQILERAGSERERTRLLVETERVAVLGYHAGDVLFLCEALRAEQAPFRSIGVLGDYADIAAFLRPDLRCLTIPKDAVPQRAGSDVYCEFALLQQYLLHWEQARAADDPPRFYHFLRSFRSLSHTRHHLREALAFSVGGEGSALRPLQRRPRASLAPSAADSGSPQRPRILVHFEGGWSLKEYPKERRAELLSLLLAEGFQPVLLGRAEPGFADVQAVSYRGLTDFRSLLSSVQALIGCDSFPAHFADLHGIPTLQLFGSTRPENARGTESPTLRVLHHPMPCVPCDERFVCRLDGGVSCRAHATPSEIVVALRALLHPTPAAPTQERGRP